jgi:hypothetical protein
MKKTHKDSFAAANTATDKDTPAIKILLRLPNGLMDTAKALPITVSPMIDAYIRRLRIDESGFSPDFSSVPVMRYFTESRIDNTGHKVLFKGSNYSATNVILSPAAYIMLSAWDRTAWNSIIAWILQMIIDDITGLLNLVSGNSDQFFNFDS